MSSLAVFLVLGGATAFAATKIGANQLKANSVKTGKIVKEAITTSKIKNNAVNGAKVDEGSLGQVPSALNATNAQNATNAVNAENGLPRAYARVLANGAGVEEALSKGISDGNVELAGGGSVYCFELGFAPKNVQSVVEWLGGGQGLAQPAIGKYALCPAGSDAHVRTTDSGDAGTNGINFFVTFYG
ncbi:MAG: hypothetical protein JJE35_13700 [Thermoleophilia bacterium]|nr:hypothetical protein [Thermoleophilia bacterium]